MIRQLEDLGFIRYGSERAVYHTLSAGNALIIIDFSSAKFIAFNRVYSAGSRTWTLTLYNRCIWTSLRAASAFYTFFFVDMGASVYDRNSFYRAYSRTWVRQTAAAKVGYGITGFFTGITSKGNNIDQRRLIEHICDCAVIDMLRNRRVLVNRTQR